LTKENFQFFVFYI